MTVLTTDHPAWAETGSGRRARAARTASGLWVLSWDRDGLHMRCVEGTEDAKPTSVTTNPACLPSSVPGGLRAGLDRLGVSQRLATPWLWDAITTAILRQVVRAGQARKLYRQWCKPTAGCSGATNCSARGRPASPPAGRTHTCSARTSTACRT